MRGRFLFLFAPVIATAIACSSAPPDPPAQLESPTRRSTKNETTNDPPPTSNLQSADASTGSDAGGGSACKAVAPNYKCGLDPQCGCGMNETCEVTNDATGATSCITGGTATLGRPCQNSGECVAGLTCTWGACRPYCTSALTKCNAPGTELCIPFLDAQNKPMTNLNFCTVACDPFDPKGVCGTNSCHWFESAYKPFLVSDCNFPGPSALKGTCQSDDDCAAGLLCIASKCEKWCRIGQAGDCPSNVQCKDYFMADAPVIGGVKRGVCLN